MAETILTNVGLFNALYGEEPVDFSTNEVSTVIIHGITATKEVDKEYWVNGPLTYTIKVKNESGTTLDNLVLTDVLNITYTTFDTDYGVYINEDPVIYTVMSDILTVALPSLEEGETVTVTFRVLQV